MSTSTRLLVDLNRSPHHPRVFSELTRSLPPADRQEILDRYHTPRRRVVERAVRDGIARGGTTVHLALHSFTPVLDGVPRHTDLALLYDPRRGTERDLARVWVRELRGAFDGWRIRRNHPYRGTSDGLTTTLRRLAPEERYLGIEIELSQGRLDDGGRYPPGLEQILARTLATAWTAVSRG